MHQFFLALNISEKSSLLYAPVGNILPSTLSQTNSLLLTVMEGWAIDIMLIKGSILSDRTQKMI